MKAARGTGTEVDEVRSEFINVDLDLKSSADLSPLLRAFGTRVMSMHVPRIGRKYWMRLMLGKQPKTPGEGILRFAKLVTALPARERQLWNRATKEFDLGFQCGLERRSAEWVLDPEVVHAAAKVGAQLRVTMYSPQLVIDAATAAHPKRVSRRKSRAVGRSRAQ